MIVILRFLVASCLLLGLARCDRGQVGSPPNVVLVVVDTLGAQHIGCYGGEASTPQMDALAARGVRFERAYAAAPWTMPSIASIFTGRMPSRHGVRDLVAILGEEESTLAELLQQRGYATHAVISHRLIGPQRGFAQGFGGYDGNPIGGPDGISSQEVTDRSIEFLKERAENSQPFLLFAHYFDPHYAYHHHPAFAQIHPAYEGPVESGMDIWNLREMRSTLCERDIEHLLGLYREEIAHTDHHLGRLWSALEANGLTENTLVVLTADHGEELMEHGWIGHTRTLHEELLRVPLIIAWPETIKPAVLATPVSLIDVLPTVAQLVGLARDAAWDGLSLAPTLRGNAALPSNRPVLAEVSFGPRKPPEEMRDPKTRAKAAHQTALILNDLKLIHDEFGQSYRLFDLGADPGELHELDGHASEEVLRNGLLRWEASRSAKEGASVSMDADELEELRQLGYVR